MARTIAQTSATKPDDLVTNLNTLLGTLTDPVIVGLGLSVSDEQRQTGRKFDVLLTYDTGGASLATPFLVALYQSKSMAALVVALQTFITANAYFFATPIFFVIDDQVHTPAYCALLLYNTTTGASANFLPLNP